MTRTFLMILCNTNYDWLLQSRVEVKGISRLGQFWTRFFYLLHFTSSRPILYILTLHYLVGCAQENSELEVSHCSVWKFLNCANHLCLIIYIVKPLSYFLFFFIPNLKSHHHKQTLYTSQITQSCLLLSSSVQPPPKTPPPSPTWDS